VAARFEGTEFTVTGTAATLTSLLGYTAKLHFSHIAIRADITNAASVFIGKSNVTTATNRCGFIRAGEAFEIALEGMWTDTDQIFLVGTASDKCYVAIVV
jgi:hypothetical protein